jgi:hypothetical protein
LARGRTIALALLVSGVVAGATIASMSAFSLKTGVQKSHFMIAEPVAIKPGSAPTLPTATIIDFTSEPVLKVSLRSLATEISWGSGEADRADDDLRSDSNVPLPRMKPVRDVKLASATAGLEAFSSNDGVVTPSLQAVQNYGNWPRDAVAGAREKCESVLRGLDVKLKTKDPIGSPRGCGIAYPVSVSAVAGVAITPAATLNCEMAAALHRWITQVAQPAAKQEFNTRLTGLQNASSYACRLRNNSSTGKLSEHGLGNAIDIADFRFSNRMEASVAGSWSGSVKGLSLSSRGDFLKRSRAGACKYFNTVLGPGSDPFHKDHFHLDLMKLRAGRGKYCR